MRIIGLLLVLGVVAAVSSAVTGTSASAAPPAAPAAVPPMPEMPAIAPYPDWLPAGGLYGRQKWVPGSNGVDVFLARGAEIRAPFDGVVVDPLTVVFPYPPPVPSVALRDDENVTFYMGHVRPLVQPGTRVLAGDLLAVVDDPSLEAWGSGGPGPGGWQHVDLNLSRRGTFTWYGGDIAASDWLQQTGYQGTLVDRTPGPPDAGAASPTPTPQP
jgi:hypothetical protein